jgi:hypothetical protein
MHNFKVGDRVRVVADLGIPGLQKYIASYEYAIGEHIGEMGVIKEVCEGSMADVQINGIGEIVCDFAELLPLIEEETEEPPLFEWEGWFSPVTLLAFSETIKKENHWIKVKVTEIREPKEPNLCWNCDTVTDGTCRACGMEQK